MKIELTDRDYWLTKVEKRISHITKVRERENKRIESLPWYKRIFFNEFEYPCTWGWLDMYDLESIRKALISIHTGRIYISEEEFRAIER